MEPLNRLAWRELNGTRNYPFTDNSSLFFDGGLLPQSWILDARIYMAGNYQESGTCYVSKLTRSYDSITLTVSTASGVELGAAVVFFSSVDQIVPDPAATYANPGHVGSYTDEDNQWSRPIQIVSTAGNRAGCLIVDMTQTALAQALAEGEYVLDDTVAVFLPSVCEYSPYPQVVSINGKSGDVRITGSNGIQVKAFGGDTIKVSVVGDPNFENRRYFGCHCASWHIYRHGSKCQRRSRVQHGAHRVVAGFGGCPFKRLVKRSSHFQNHASAPLHLPRNGCSAGRHGLHAAILGESLCQPAGRRRKVTGD